MEEFLLEPREIIISNFEPLQEIRKKFRFKNKSKKSTRFKFVLQNSEYFKLIGPTVSGKKTSLLSPGLEAVCTILFLPVEKVDYNAELLVLTTEKKYSISLKACVGQADVRFPKVVNFSKCPVKHMTEKVIYIQNQGQKSTRLILNVPQPFFVEPTEIFLNKEEGKQVKFSFHPKTIGNFKKILKIEYEEDGLQDRVKMIGESQNVDCVLSVKTIKFPPTFIVTKSVKEVYLHNKSNIKLNYKFSRFKNEAEEENYLKMKELQQEATDSSDLLFKDDVFALYPLQGEIWPNSKAFINVVFIPNTEDSFKKIAYCETTGKETRLSMNLVGEGKGPEIVFSYSKLDVGNVYIHTTHTYEIYLENRGDIDADFELKRPKTAFGTKFTFEPSKGNLEGGGLQEIKVSFTPNTIGEFYEAFQWVISGRAKPVTNIFSGTVMGPTFCFDKEEIDFGVISYGFLNSKEILLKNTSEISLKFNLRVPKDGTLLSKEFDIIPSNGSILPEASKLIRVEFLSHHVQEYEHDLVLDIEDVGEGVLSVPIKATCIVPEISISSKRINFGYCFVGYPYNRTIEMENKEGNEKAKYEVILPNDIEDIDISCKDSKGVINSRESSSVKFTLIVKRITKMEFPIFIRVIGSEENPFEITVVCKSIGPIIEPSAKSLNFGFMNVLEDYEKSIRVYNKSPIVANYETLLKNKKIFTCLNPTGSINPNSFIDLLIKANLDESQKFKDNLKITIKGTRPEEDHTLVISIIAKGKGCSLTSNIDLEKIDFLDLFTKTKEVVNFTITNHGRNQRQLLWKSSIKKPKPGSDTPASPVVFFIEPDRSIINPKSSQDFQCIAMSKKPGEFKDVFIGSIPSKRKDIFKVQVSGKFSVPLISFPQQKPMKFSYTHSEDNPPSIEKKQLVIKNMTVLDLQIVIKTSAPFKVDVANHIIKSQENILVDVLFDPDYNKDKLSRVVKSKILINYKEHPQVDSFDVVGIINFPNLSFSKDKIDFGVVQLGEEVRKQVTAKSTSKSDVKFKWCFEVDNPEEEDNLKSFDILPISGIIKQGDSWTMDFIFSGDSIKEKKIKAVCFVNGGPKYDFSLNGDCGKVKYKIDVKKLEYGIINFNQIEMRDIILSNPGKVNFAFSFDTSSLTYPDIIKFHPSEGRVKAGKKSKISVKFCPSIPGIFDESVKLKINNLEPELIKVQAVSICPSIHLSLSRVEALEEKEALWNIKKGQHMNKKLLEFFQNQPENKIEINDDEDKEFGIIREIEMIKLRQLLINKSIQTPPKLKKIVSTRRGKSRNQISKIQNRVMFSQVEYTLSTYELDFKYLVKGISRKKKFVLTNIGYYPISIKIEKKKFLKNGIVLEPSSVTNIPRFEKQEFELILQTKKIPKAGKYVYEAPIKITNGPIANIKIMADIVIPKINVSSTELDFGSLFVGKCKVITIQFENNEEVKAEWYIEQSHKNKNFVFTERKGTILPKEQKNFEVYFYPSSKKKFQFNFNVKCKYNPKPISIKCFGVGKEVELEFSESKFDFETALPHTKVEKTLTINNKSDVDVELYAANYDKQFLDEIEILKENSDKFSENGLLLVDPVKPGSGLPEFLMAERRKEELEREKLEKIAEEEALEKEKSKKKKKGSSKKKKS